MELREIMTRELRCAAPTDTIRDVARMMRDDNIGTVPVCEEERLIGLITDRDIVVRCVAEDMDPAKCSASEHMSRDLVTASPTMFVEDAIRLMGDNQIRRLPVVEDGKLVGIVSLGDLAVEAGEEMMDEIEEGLTQISQPVHQTEDGEAKAA